MYWKNIRQIKSYADMFQATSGLTIQKILKIRISSQKSFQNESFFSFSLKRFDLNYIPRKNTTIKIAWYHSYSSKHFISKKIVFLLLIHRDDEISQTYKNLKCIR